MPKLYSEHKKNFPSESRASLRSVFSSSFAPPEFNPNGVEQNSHHLYRRINTKEPQPLYLYRHFWHYRHYSIRNSMNSGSSNDRLEFKRNSGSNMAGIPSAGQGINFFWKYLLKITRGELVAVCDFFQSQKSSHATSAVEFGNSPSL